MSDAHPETDDDAAEELEELEREAPVRPDFADPDAPGRAASRPLDQAPDIEPNEPG